VKRGLLALSPLIVFVVLYLVTSIVAGDFYKVPITVAFMLSSIYAVAVLVRYPLSKRIQIYSSGAGSSNMMLMFWIFVLAGAFASSAKAMGAIDATVNLTLTLLPHNLILAGLFLAACFISLSVGTSVGTIAALAPIAVGLAHSTGSNVPMLTAVVVGGSFFGDNLSFISDTTIVATQTQGCRLKDKFIVNSQIIMPAALIVLGIYVFTGHAFNAPANIPHVDYIKVLPYIVVLITAIIGVNVMAVLTIGIAMTAIIGIPYGAFDIFGWFKAMGDGIVSMGELIIITMMAGGMLELINKHGGIAFIIKILTSKVHGKRGAELAIAALVSITDLCTANNTVAIITVGGIAKHISQKYGIDPRKSASILDTFSCCMQGIIPYGAQMLIAAGLATINPISILPYLYYPVAMGIMATLAILLQYPHKYK
jgi:Na+/H+ antiporter NhaC